MKVCWQQHTHWPSPPARRLLWPSLRMLSTDMPSAHIAGSCGQGQCCRRAGHSEAVCLAVQVSVLNGDKKMISAIDATPAGIS